jgi:hypothetical protein
MNRLPKGTTEEKLQVWLAALGIDIPLDHIAVKERRDGDMGAVVCYPQEVAVRLLNWAIGDQKLGGRPVLAEYKPQRIGEWW